MSSYRNSVCRKRPYISKYYTDSDEESEPEVIPLKQRKLNGTNIVSTFKHKVSNLIQWLSKKKKVKASFTEILKTGKMEVIDVSDDDDDCTIIAMHPKTQATSRINKNPAYNRSEKAGIFTNLRSRNSIEPSKNSRFSQTVSPFKGHNGVKAEASNSPRTRSNCKIDELGLSAERPSKTSEDWEKLSYNIVLGLPDDSPLSTNDYDNEIQCVLDTRKSHEVELVSKTHSPKSTALVSPKSKTSSLRMCRKENMGKANRRLEISSKHANKFTANEIVRLEEKAQYQKMLDEFAKKAEMNKNVMPVDTESIHDLSDDDSELQSFSYQFLHQPVADFMKPFASTPKDGEKWAEMSEFMRKIHCEGILLKKLNQKFANVKEFRASGDDDDEVLVLDVKLPKYKSKSKMVTRSDFFSGEWISELKNIMVERTLETNKIIAEQEQRLQELRKKRAAKYAAQKRHQDGLRLKGGIVFEDSYSELDLELTPEMEMAVDKALSTSNKEEVLSSLQNNQVRARDLDTLVGSSWLNDEIINYYMALIVQRSEKENYPKAYAFSTFFYTKLKSGGHKNVKRWTRKIDIFAYDFNLIPLHLGYHWALAVVDHQQKSVAYYDSMGGNEFLCLDILRDYLIEEKKDKKQDVLDPNEWTFEIVKDIPPQMNGCDCGMFTIKYAEYITRGVKITFTQADIPFFRRRVMYEILTNQLL